MEQSSDALGKRKRGTGQALSNKLSVKRKRQAKSKTTEYHHLDVQAGVNEAIGHMDVNLLADHVAQNIRRFEPELSSVELEGRYISGNLVLC